MTDTDVNQRLVEAGSTVEMAEALGPWNCR